MGERSSLWRGSLLPLGCEAAALAFNAVLAVKSRNLVCACCAGEREQAPSPQKPAWRYHFETISCLVTG
ncbi:hypothetical protein EMIT0P100_220095 [Pseudomonas sp. IT-P100]